jgi:hypothetical protein
MERRAPQAELPAKALPAKDAGKAKSEITKGAVASGASNHISSPADFKIH